jgi:hypothetical protein
MHNITLICTIHTEIGQCNSNELYRIIEEINPEIIFDEIPSSRYNAHFIGQSVTTLETDAIKRYMKNHKVNIIPVDNYEFSEIQKGDIDYNKISNNNMEYYNLLKEQYSLLIQHGFSYINSNQHFQLIDNLQIIEKKVLEKLNDNELSQLFKIWYEIADNRENEIIKSVYNYCREHTFDIGILLIGAEHRNSIINKIEKYNGELEINWRYNSYYNIK